MTDQKNMSLQLTEVQEVVRFQTPDGQVHDTREAANNHVRLLEMRRRLVAFAYKKYVANMDVQELAEFLEVNMTTIMEIYAGGLQEPQVVESVADREVMLGDYTQLKNLDLTTTLVNSCERVGMIGSGGVGYTSNRRVAEACRVEVLRRLSTSAYT